MWGSRSNQIGILSASNSAKNKVIEAIFFILTLIRVARTYDAYFTDPNAISSYKLSLTRADAKKVLANQIANCSGIPIDTVSTTWELIAETTAWYDGGVTGGGFEGSLESYYRATSSSAQPVFEQCISSSLVTSTIGHVGNILYDILGAIVLLYFAAGFLYVSGRAVYGCWQRCHGNPTEEGLPIVTTQQPSTLNT